MKFAAYLMAVAFIAGRVTVHVASPEYAQTEASIGVSLLTAIAVGVAFLVFCREGRIMTPSIVALRDLIPLLESATAGSREMDLMIGQLWPEPRPFSKSTEQQRGGKPPVYHFTTSIDASEQLRREVLPNAEIAMLYQNADGVRFALSASKELYLGFSPTEPLARCVALVEALIAHMEGNHGRD